MFVTPPPPPTPPAFLIVTADETGIAVDPPTVLIVTGLSPAECRDWGGRPVIRFAPTCWGVDY